MKQMGFEKKKVTRKRKPMTEEQKKAKKPLNVLQKHVQLEVTMVLSLFTIVFVIYPKTISYTGRK